MNAPVCGSSPYPALLQRTMAVWTSRVAVCSSSRLFARAPRPQTRARGRGETREEQGRGQDTWGEADEALGECERGRRRLYGGLEGARREQRVDRRRTRERSKSSSLEAAGRQQKQKHKQNSESKARPNSRRYTRGGATKELYSERKRRARSWSGALALNYEGIDMLAARDEEEGESLNSMHTSVEKNTNDGLGSSEIPFCGCLTVKYYQPYFDIDTADVVKRIGSAVFYCRTGSNENFMATTAEKPDAYGPFWIATSLVFTVAVTSHISRWVSSWMLGVTWEYDFQSVVTAASLVYGFAAVVPLALYLVFGNYGARLSLVHAVCLYGYSLFVYIPAAVICFLPYGWVSWVSLQGAGIVSGLFLLRNLAPLVAAHARQHEAFILGFIGLVNTVFSLSLKVCFYYK